MLKTNILNINNGISLGDTLSPLLFGIILIPLSTEFKNTDHGYKTATKNLLFYKDDLKLYAKNE